MPVLPLKLRSTGIKGVIIMPTHTLKTPMAQFLTSITKTIANPWHIEINSRSSLNLYKNKFMRKAIIGLELLIDRLLQMRIRTLKTGNMV
jgi:regulator of PEP synthase PpsR (kinase-PPPase family)